jgi:diguanylate cyclase (GGDEF)-like protein
MTGLEVIQTIKASNPGIVPIVITGKGSMQSSLEAIRLEVSDYLEKPLNLSSIKESIARGLQRRTLKYNLVQAEARQQGFLDPLTGLPDRSQFMQRLARALDARCQEKERLLAVLLVNVDRFKNVNESYGHLVGDKVLIELARRFEALSPTASSVARLDGDTFAILIEKAGSNDVVMAAAQVCQDAAQQQITVGGTTVTLDVSVGIVIKRNRAHSTDDVLRDAEMALNDSKKQGGGKIQVFDQRMLERALASLQFENQLRMGIKNDEFVLHFQPIIQVQNRQLCGYEALIRWNHPERGLLYPRDFIPLAEDIGIINQIGHWVLHEACHQLKVWQSRFADHKNIALNVNIAGCHFLQPGFLKFLQHLIADNDLDPNNLVLELTESVLMEDSLRAIEIVKGIRASGIRLAVDDFGTGYSAFSYLQQLPLDQLKIGASFVNKLAVNAGSCEIVKTIVDLSKRLGLSVVAEGVENEAQFKKIKSLGVDMVQGFLFSRPVSKDVVMELAHQHWKL